MATLDYVDDWAARLRSRLYTQFRSAVSWQAWCDEVLGPQFQDLEDAAQTLLTMLDIESSEGAQLDVIGRIIGQPRGGDDDDTYRLYLSARVLANKSTGTVEDLFKIFRALFGQEEARPTYAGGWVKQFAIRIGAVLTRGEALIGAEFLGDAKEAAARGLLEWQEYADSLMFEFASDHATVSSTTTSGLGAGVATEIPLNSVTDFPSSGQVVIDLGGAQEEYILYGSVNTSTKKLQNLTPSTVVKGHSSGATVQVIFGSGLGFDDGYFAGAKQA